MEEEMTDQEKERSEDPDEILYRKLRRVTEAVDELVIYLAHTGHDAFARKIFNTVKGGLRTAIMEWDGQPEDSFFLHLPPENH
jgi:hypothetical protein